MGPALVEEVVGQSPVGGECDRARDGPRVAYARGDLLGKVAAMLVVGKMEGMPQRGVAVEDEAVELVVSEAENGAMNSVDVVDAVGHGNVVGVYHGSGILIQRIEAEKRLVAVPHAVAIAVGVGRVGLLGEFLGVEKAVAIGIDAHLDGSEQYVAPSALVVLVANAHQVGTNGEASRGQLRGQHALHLGVEAVVGRLEVGRVAFSRVGPDEPFGRHDDGEARGIAFAAPDFRVGVVNMDGLEKNVAPGTVVILVTHANQVRTLRQAGRIEILRQNALHLRVEGSVMWLECGRVAFPRVDVHEILGRRDHGERGRIAFAAA